MTTFLLALAVAASAAPSPAPAPETERPAAYAEVVSVGGRGRLTRGGERLGPGAPLRFGDRLELSRGRAVLRIRGAGHVLVKGRSSFSVGSAEEPGFFLKLGAMLSVLRKLEHDAFRVRTPTVVAAVRGTHFYVESRPKDSYVCVCEGSVELADPADDRSKHMLVTEKHTARVYRKHEKGLQHSPGEMLGHSDDERDELSSLDRP